MFPSYIYTTETNDLRKSFHRIFLRRLQTLWILLATERRKTIKISSFSPQVLSRCCKTLKSSTVPNSPRKKISNNPKHTTAAHRRRHRCIGMAQSAPNRHTMAAAVAARVHDKAINSRSLIICLKDFFSSTPPAKQSTVHSAAQGRENGLGEGEEWQEFGAANTSLTLAHTGVATSPDL